MVFVNGMIASGMSCQLIHYAHVAQDTFFEPGKGFNFIIVRCNPGQIKAMAATSRSKRLTERR